MESNTNLNDMHANLTNWVKDLLFYKDELKTFQTRLEDVVKQNTTTEVLAEVEHFQNQFIRQNEVIDTLKHDFKKVDKEVVLDVLNQPGAANTALANNPANLQDQYDTFVKIYSELKLDFEKFLAKTF